MKIKDPLYGSIEVREPVIIDIIQSPSFIRLKGVSQLGLPGEYWPVKGYSRYEHSIGVYMLLQKLGATVPEQISGLIHDISHSAFSHIADWVFREAETKRGQENYQDDQLHEYLDTYSNIPKILNKYNYWTERIIDTKSYTLLEQPIPNICADRLDYSLREIYYNHGKSLARNIAKDIINLNGEMVFSSRKSAQTLAKYFIKMQKDDWGRRDNIKRYYEFARILKDLLNQKKITKKDLYTKSELELMKIINKTKHSYVVKELKKDPLELPEIGLRVNKKFRYIDPKIYNRGIVIKLSNISKSYKKSIESNKKLFKQGITI